jgi:hypothetical protein
MTTAALPRSLRGEIENVLRRKIGKVPVAGTAKWIAIELVGETFASSVTPAHIRAVESVLKELAREGRVTTRLIYRSGELVWKLTDKHHNKWQTVGASTLAGRP